MNLKKTGCTECHDEWESIDRQFEKSVHARAKPEVIRCSTCHNPHYAKAMKIEKNRIASLCEDCHGSVETLAKKHDFFIYPLIHIEKADCSECHGSPHETAVSENAKRKCFECHKDKEMLVAKVQNKHEWLELPSLHLSKIDCYICHRPDTVIRNCTDCHGEKPILTENKEEHSSVAGFRNPDVIKKYDHVAGATGLKLIDIIGITIVAGALLLAAGHGGLRFLVNKLRGIRK
jgi:predicted CXXCH cytochrome family protein